MLEVISIKTLDECSAYERSWERLVRDMEYPSPFVHPSWVLTAMRFNADKWLPYILLVLERGELIGLLPLYQNKENSSFRELRFAGDCYYPDPLGICCKSEDLDRCINALKQYLKDCRDWDTLCLKWLLQDEAKCWESPGGIIKESSIAPYIPLPENFQLYLKAFKKKINFAIRKVKKFDKANGQYHSTKSPDKSKQLLARLFDLHKQRSEERGIESSFCGDAIVSFHNNVMERYHNLYTHWLTVDEEIIAVLYGFFVGGRFFYYQIAHDPKHGSLSPGAVLLYKAIEQCCKDGAKEFNFLQGDETYKWKWTKDSRRLYTVKMYNRSVRGSWLRQKDKMRSIAKAVYAFMKQKLSRDS